jgi:formamidopyrimidine-DNA glycosylase
MVMPELPEVETMCRGIAGCVGRRIAVATVPRGRVRPIVTAPRAAVLTRRLAGRTITRVFRRGKRVVLEVTAADDRPLWLVIEPRMTGLMLVADPPSAEHVRLELSLHADAAAATLRLLFWDRRGLGTIRLLDARGLERACGVAKLGPDGLVVTAEELVGRLARSRRAVKMALLDQRAVAGIGNIYAAEILFRAGIDPRTSCRRIGRAAWERVAACTRAVLAEAVRHEGSSIGDETYQTALGKPGRFQQRHRVYGREGRPCARCRTPIVRIVQAQRSTFYCPQCQCRHPQRRHLPA